MNDAVSVGGGGIAWKGEYKAGESALISAPITCGCVAMCDTGGGDHGGGGERTVDGSDGQRACVLVLGVPVCRNDVTPSASLCRRRYCLRLYRKQHLIRMNKRQTTPPTVPPMMAPMLTVLPELLEFKFEFRFELDGQ